MTLTRRIMLERLMLIQELLATNDKKDLGRAKSRLNSLIKHLDSDVKQKDDLEYLEFLKNRGE